jgi:two-component system sensor histidine kinase KdpD
MSRIEAGVLRARVETVDLTDAVATSARNVGRVWPEIKVRDRVEDGIMVRADAAFLDRVLTNLLDNAARSAKAAASDVEVTSKQTDGRVTIRVIDHGSGIPAEAREVLFHPFYELDQRNPRLGAGLGLAIAKGFALAMDGEIWVEDTAGEGATFEVAVPVSSARP